jgi:pyruvate/2-oxoglutarate dehydrogenase complex dihydrolipoamide acyltransferase (E2) component
MRRRTIARRLAESARTAPHLTADMQIDMRSVMAARSRINAAEADAGRPRISLLSFVAAALCRVLPGHPALNATYLEARMLHWKTINLGIAVDTDDGLIVPVLRDAGALSLQEMNTAIAAAAERARAGRTEAGELDGCTFTISNPGSLGPVLRAEAILNPPQVALLGLPALQYAPVAVSDAAGGFRVEVRPLLRTALTFDHRALDGGQVIRFLNALKQDLESTA